METNTHKPWYTGKVTDPLLDGEIVELKGQKFVIAEFNIARAKKAALATREARRTAAMNSSAATAIATGDELSAIESMESYALIALRANYPEMKAEDIAEHLAPRDLSTVMSALRKVNGGGDEGEAKAAAENTTAANPTGTA